jgi:multidrug efflux pump
MNISEAFIRRPTATTLIAIGLLLMGAVAYFRLPVAPLPQVDFPTIQVSASLPGANAETMATSIATPLERAFSIVPQVTSMTSSSAYGSTSITLQFELSRNIDAAAQDVQTAINAAGGFLPKNMPRPPTYHKVNPADFTVMSLALISDTRPLTELSRYADDFLAPQISQMPGVGLVDYHGEQRPAVRVQVDPDALAARGLTLADVRNMIGVSTVNQPKGSVDGQAHAVTLNTTDQLLRAEDYRSMVVAYKNGAQIHLADLGTIIDGPEDRWQAATLQGKSTVIVDIHKQPGYNVIATTQAIKDRLPLLTAALPSDVKVSVVGDRTQTINASVKDVEFSLMLSIGMVLLVIFAFLRNVSMTVIPSVTIPLSLVATFGAMYLLGYSLDNLSIMGLTIAIGFLVDDAIVVTENIVRHVEAGERPLQAAIAGTRQVASTIVSMTISLVAVFIPILLMGGIIGRLFQEFAVTVSVAIVVSGLISLTVTPMMAARMLKPIETAQHGWLYRKLESLFDSMLSTYRRTLDVVFRHQGLTLGIVLVTFVATVALYVWIPKGFFPQQDTGLITATAESASDIPFAQMRARMVALADIVQADPDVDNVYYWLNGGGGQGRMMINLKEFSQRHATADQIMARLKSRTATVSGVGLFMQVRQDIQVGGRPSKTQYQYTLQDANSGELAKWSAILRDKLKSLPQLKDVTTDQQQAAPQMTLDIDRATAARLGINTQVIDDALYDAFGQRQVATLFTQLNQYHVILEVDPRWQVSTDTLKHLYVRSSTTNDLVPLSMLGNLKNGVAPITINHQGLFPSVTISFNISPGYALGDATTAIERAATAAGIPESVIGTFQGTAQAFQSSLKSQPWLILAAVIAVYIVLGVLYESAIHPLTIISTLPSAGVGALLALALSGQDLSIMGMIGIILLIGIVKKNAIMMVDFALEAERAGKPPLDAIREGCLLRFRPIMMTTMAALMGALPLALGTGAGAELRRPLGIAIVGGLLVSQLLTLYTTPVVYLMFDRWRIKWSSRGTRLATASSV